MEDAARLDHLCRMWLLTIAILHWIVFVLLVHGHLASASLGAKPQTHYARAIVGAPPAI